MKNLSKYILIIVGFVAFSAFTLKADAVKTQYKVLVQMKNYTGEGAYLVVSVVDGKGKYLKTLQVLGDDKEWYPDIAAWWSHQKGRKMSEVDAISGATVAGGERSTFSIQVDDSWMNKGYKLRFETAVEEVEYYKSDLEISLDSHGLKAKNEGKGFIRYVRLLPMK